MTKRKINWRRPEIGILTILPVERAAVELFVDDPLVEPSAGTGADPYRLGSVPSLDPTRPHRVVIASASQRGPHDAAALSADLARAYPDLSAVVMCGIAAGTGDTRIGDIVAASDVIDHGQPGPVARTGPPQPVDGISQVLRQADHDLERGETGGRRPWIDLIQRLEPTVPPELRRPPHGTRGLPRVHRGVIASGAPRDTGKRDEFARKHAVVAFLNGASHLPGPGVPWFMVRGISHWAAAPAGDGWQGYAAFVAAAYVQTLLGCLAPQATTPGEPTTRDLADLVDAVLTLDAMADTQQRRAFVGLLPNDIRLAVPDNVNARMHVISIVRTCQRFPGGMTVLVDTLRLAFDDSPEVKQVRSIVERHWRADPDDAGFPHRYEA